MNRPTPMTAAASDALMLATAGGLLTVAAPTA